MLKIGEMFHVKLSEVFLEDQILPITISFDLFPAFSHKCVIYSYCNDIRYLYEAPAMVIIEWIIKNHIKSRLITDEFDIILITGSIFSRSKE